MKEVSLTTKLQMGRAVAYGCVTGAWQNWGSILTFHLKSFKEGEEDELRVLQRGIIRLGYGKTEARS